jgi:hypothetical protein
MHIFFAFSIDIMTNFEETGEAFWKWLQNNGTSLSKDIAIKDFRSEGAGRGVIATKDIKVIFDIIIRYYVSNLTLIGRRTLIFASKIYFIISIN